MKKRTKTEVRIRNILSDILLTSIKEPLSYSILHSLKVICERNLCTGKVDVRDIQRCIDWESVSRDSCFLSLFCVSPEGMVELREEFKGYGSYICSRVKSYWRFLSKELQTNKEFSGDELKKGILLFNSGFYFECHEFLEDLWKRSEGREKEFLKGLIHACVAFYHLEYENQKGALGYLKRSYNNLKGFIPVFWGIDVKDFTRGLLNCVEVLKGSSKAKEQLVIPKLKVIS